MAAIMICSDFGAQKNSLSLFPFFPHLFAMEWCHWPYVMIFVFWMLNFKPNFELSSCTFIKRLFSSLLSAVRMVSTAFLRLLIFLLAILIPAYTSSISAFLMMYSACKLNKQGVTIYSLDVLLSQFEISPLLHVQFWLLLPDLHTGFSWGRSCLD